MMKACVPRAKQGKVSTASSLNVWYSKEYPLADKSTKVITHQSLWEADKRKTDLRKQ